jgi:predicted TIM-barrel fold metal-dependent hydrolase
MEGKEQCSPIISADSHVIEPPNLWTERLDRKYRDRAPRIFWDEERRGWLFGCEVLPPALINSLYAVDKSPEEFAEQQEVGIEAVRRGGNDPGERLKDMELDGVAAEVLYTSLGMSLYWLKDAAFQKACFQVYNNWLAEFVSYAPNRFAGVGLIPLWDVDDAVHELYRCRTMGLRGVAIWASSPEERAFTSLCNDPFWRAAQELEMPVGLHVLTGYQKSPKLFDYTTDLGRIQRNMTFPEEIQHSLTDIIFSGVLERFPNLKLVLVENDIGWLAYQLLHADRIHVKLGPIISTSLTMKPSEYFKRQVYATFMEDEVGILTMQLLGAGNFMWGSDYPHYESTWPKSQEVLTQSFKNTSDKDRLKVVYENCAKLYDLDPLRF